MSDMVLKVMMVMMMMMRMMMMIYHDHDNAIYTLESLEWINMNQQT
jgi:hypothetical protein